MSDDDIHDMMGRAHYAEIREARLRIEVDRLKAENERLSEVAAAEMKLREGNFDTITQLEADSERWRRDAERYRWICQFPEDADYALTHALNRCDGTGDGPSCRDLLSDAIDAALAAKETMK